MATSTVASPMPPLPRPQCSAVATFINNCLYGNLHTLNEVVNGDIQLLKINALFILDLVLACSDFGGGGASCGGEVVMLVR